MPASGMTETDVVVVGAGPSGSVAARDLARGGARVIVLEEHGQIGAPCHCAGLVSPRTLELAGLEPADHRLREYSRARVWGPLGSAAWLESSQTQAVAIDRSRFDLALAEQARAAGAEFRLSLHAESFECLNGHALVTAANCKGPVRLKASLVIGADGVHSKVARWLDGKEQKELVPAVKAEVRFEGTGPEEIEVFVGNRMAPGWFGWIIPLQDGHARVGLGGSCRDIAGRFEAFLGEIRSRMGPFREIVRQGWLITARPANRVAFDHGMLVGDAAGQAKPSSGGGIYMGMKAGQLAAKTALEALALGDPSYRVLQRYEARWQTEAGHELRYNHFLRSLFNRLNDAEIDRLVALCNAPWAHVVINRLGDIDFASRLFRPVLGALEAVAPSMLGGLTARRGRPTGAGLDDNLWRLEIDPDGIL